MDIFFMDVIPVPPPVVRPANKFKNEIREHPQTTILKSIIDSNLVLKAIVKQMNGTENETMANDTQVCMEVGFEKNIFKMEICLCL